MWFSPIWFIAKWFGAPWTIEIERNGTEVREAKVRGWRYSQRGILEFVDSAADGTLDRQIIDKLPTETSLPPEMNVTPEAWTKLPLETKVTLWRMYNSGQLHRR
ncbi:MAG: hypothetical protein QOD36_1565 [Mycobacterium sp.]|nr:hypothetical protein [Mycobacterium sp.]